MKKYTTIILAVVALMSVHTAFAASSDYLLKLGGVDGESTESSAGTSGAPARIAPPPSPPSITVVSDTSGGTTGEVVACTMDAKQCPDGTYVGRSGPKCEFVCPTAPAKISPPTSTGQRGKVNIAVGDVDGDGRSEAKGKVETGWKVEEGTKSPAKPNSGDVAPPTDGQPLTPDFGILLGGGADVDGDGMEDLVFSDPSEARAAYIKLGEIKGEAKEGKEIRKNITINLRAKELREADEATRADVLALAPTTTEAVRSGDDLALLILRDAMENPSIEGVDIDTTKMVIHHEAQGKFLGLFKIAYKESIEVGREGDVKVRLPWYSFLVNEDLDEDEIALVAKEKKKEKPMQIESWSFGASQAGMYKAVSDKIKASYDLKMNKKA